MLGLGSIGRRHCQLLLDHGISVGAWTPSALLSCAELEKHRNFIFFKDLNLALSRPWDCLYVCTVSSHHRFCLELALRKRLNIFVEKPVCVSFAGLPTVVECFERYGLLTHVGSNMRFHFGPERLKELIESREFGDVVSAQIYAGMRLTDWKPNQNYRHSYSAKKSLGGGATLDFIHEIDLINWLFGFPGSVSASVVNTGALEIETEDSVDAILKVGNKVLNLHLDYLRRPFERRIEINFESGFARWCLSSNDVITNSYLSGEIRYETAPAFWEHQTMYEKQTEYWLNCLKHGVCSMSDLAQGVRALQIAEAIKLSGASDSKNIELEEINEF